MHASSTAIADGSNGSRVVVTLMALMRMKAVAPVFPLASLLAGCAADPTSLGGPLGTSSGGESSTGEPPTAPEGSSGSVETTIGETTIGEATIGETATDEDIAGDGSTTSEPDPPPAEGLGPWGFGYVELPEIEADWVTFGDFDADGNVDLFARRADPGEFRVATVTVYSGDGSGSFVEVASRVVSWSFGFMKAGDYDGDGDLDAALFDDYSDESFGLMQGDGTGTLGALTSVELEGFFGFGATPMRDDLDADDDLFIPLGHSQGGFVAVADGAGSFSPGATVPQPACYFSGTVATDFDGDGLDEVVATGSCNAIPGGLPLVVYRHVGGVLTAVQSIQADLGPVIEGGDVALVDVDEDGDLDVVTATTLGLYVLENQGDGVLADPPQVMPHAYEGYARRVIPLHLDGGDQRAVVLAEPDVRSLLPALVVPDAAWATATTHMLDLQGRVAGSADVDGDGLTDVAVLVGDPPGALGLWLSGG